MPLDVKNEGGLKVHNKTKLETILHGNTQTLLTQPSKSAAKESQNAKLRDTEQTGYAPKFANSKVDNQYLSSELSKSTFNAADNEDDVFERKVQTIEPSPEASAVSQSTQSSQLLMQRISTSSNAVVESETMAPYTLLKENTGYTTRKKKIHQQNVSDFREFKEKYDNLLDKEYEMKQEIHSILNFNEMKKKKHHENIYRQWTKKVYNPLSKKVQENVQSSPWSSTCRKKHEMYKNYLKYVNTKGCAYLDTADPEEYSIYPYPNKVPGKVNVTDPDNPLHFTSQQYDEELQVILSLLTGKNYSRNDIENLKLFSRPDSSSSRQKMDATKWLLMPENNILSTPRTASRRKIHAGRYNKSMLSESC
ncbi:protein FAM228B isoform X3 [Octopus bimaculoides]|uniref:protein FAM228B isoform X3 n=1 Tax=Octopus bimaculoides TaxID=37653 RepID=UPI00071CBFD7|nr:protein FAM228B isoform X3 [Octopus bimaculoides]|eukprot:XP_014782454.1 PREDICTED: protein FAM228B-like isoform X3 [Octopus bimaculoides]